MTAWARKACSSPSLEQAIAKGKLFRSPCIWGFSGALTQKVIMCWFVGWTLATARGEQDVLWLKPLLPFVKDMKILLMPLFWSEDPSYSIWREVSLRNLLSTLVAKNRSWDAVTMSREQTTPVLSVLFDNYILTQQPAHHFPKIVCSGRHAHGQCCQLNNVLWALGQHLIPPQISKKTVK